MFWIKKSSAVLKKKFWDRNLSLQHSLSQICWCNVVLVQYSWNKWAFVWEWRHMKFARCVFHSRQVDFLILFQNANLMLFFCSEAFRGFLLPEGYSTNCLAGRARPFTLWPQSTVSAFFSTLAPNVPIDNSCPRSSTQHVSCSQFPVLWFTLPYLLKLTFFFWGDSICLLRPSTSQRGIVISV